MTPRGLRKTNRPTYSSWASVIARCENPGHTSYPDYGGRGIRICSRWRQSFGTVLEDMGPRPSRHHSIGRLNNDGPYSPENCRWESRVEQQGNRRNTVLVTYQDKTQCVSAWAREFGINVYTLWARIKSMGIDKAMSQEGKALPSGARSERKPRAHTGYKGVYCVKGRFRAQLCNVNARIHLGYFATPEEAARAYNAKAIELYGEFAKLNPV